MSTQSIGAGEIREVAELLALGLDRLLRKKSSRKSADFGESSLDIVPYQSGHADTLEKG